MSRFGKTKRASEVLDYEFNWTLKNWLATGESISTSSWTATTGITIDSNENTTTTSKVWLSSGTVGETYKLVNTITTDNDPARTGVRELWVKVV